MPGRVASGSGDVPGQNSDPRDLDQRSFEYDSVTPLYGDFLRQEILPLAEKALGVFFTSDPTKRGIGGISSGGICAFNAAWHHADAFTRVLSHCGSFVNIRGGHNFPYLDELERRDQTTGLVTMCAAGGMAPAVIIERM